MEKNNKTRMLEERINEWKQRGLQENRITYGMLCDGFQSIFGIPDDFYSAEDPADRVRLWAIYQNKERRVNRRDCDD